MSATTLTPSVFPKILPIFPLTGALLLPRIKLPLNIFEPRYLAMIEDVLATPGRLLGMIQPQEKAETEASTTSLYRVGCAGRLISFHEADDGRFLISLLGVCRFQVAEELPMEGPYRRVRPDWTPFVGDTNAPATGPCDRKRLVTALQVYFKRHNIDTDWDVIHKTPDDLLISSLVMICPLQPNEKQALLEAPDFQTRATMLIALLEMALLPQPDEDGAKH